MNTHNDKVKSETVKPELQCGFCYPSQHGKNGTVKREWSVEWTMFIPLCRWHAAENTKLNEELIAKMPVPEGLPTQGNTNEPTTH